MEGESETEIVATKFTKDNERFQRSEIDGGKPEIPNNGNEMSMVPNDDTSSSTRVPSKEVVTSSGGNTQLGRFEIKNYCDEQMFFLCLLVN